MVIFCLYSITSRTYRQFRNFNTVWKMVDNNGIWDLGYLHRAETPPCSWQFTFLKKFMWNSKFLPCLIFYIWYLNYCCSRQYKVCFLILEVENFPADKFFFSSCSSQLLHYCLCSSMSFPLSSPGNFLHQAQLLHTEKTSPMHSDSYSLSPHSFPKDQLFDKEFHDKIHFLEI